MVFCNVPFVGFCSIKWRRKMNIEEKTSHFLNWLLIDYVYHIKVHKNFVVEIKCALLRECQLIYWKKDIREIMMPFFSSL